MPIPRHNEHDSAPYITAGLVIARNPKTGIQNVSINRNLLTRMRKTGVIESTGLRKASRWVIKVQKAKKKV